MTRTFRFATALMAMVSLGACASADTTASQGIVVTNSVLASIVQQVVGEHAVVETVIPDGKDPHEYQPSAGDIAKIANAKVVVANGFGYEPTLKNAIAAARADNVTVFDVEWEIPGLADNDAHWFTDPLMAATVASKLAPVLEKALGVSLDDSFAAALADFQATAEEGKKTIETTPSVLLGPCAFGSEHIFLGPFSARFGCPASAVLHAGSRVPDAEPSATDIEAFIASIKRNGLRVLLEDASEPSAVLAQVARQSGTKVVPVNVHSMGGETTYRGYIMNIVAAVLRSLT